MEGYIKIYRTLIEHPVFAHPVALKLWMWILLKASHKERHISLKVGKGETIITINSGEFIFGRYKAEEETGINGSTIYKWLKKFELEFELININSNNQYSVVSIVNWVEYQENNENVTTKEQPSNNQRTTKEQPKNNCVTTKEQLRNTNKNVKNVKNVKNIKRENENIPVYEEFSNYVLQNIPDIDKQHLELKYKSWIANDWRDGNNKPIKNWKTKSLNACAYLPRVKTDKPKLSDYQKELQEKYKKATGT